MAILRLSNDYVKQGFTQIDNLFIRDFLPSANGDDVKIYLAGLELVSSGYDGDCVEKLASSLSLSPSRIMEGFAYWDKKGIVEVAGGETVTFLSVKTPVTPVVKFNAQKYKVFTEETVRIFPDKILTPNEYNRYFEFMSSSGMEVNAMLLIMQYCKDMGGGRTSTDYVLAVARAWAEEGLLKEKQIIAKIDEMETCSEDMRTLFDALGVKRAPDAQDKQTFNNWTKGLSYSLDAVLVAARSLKKRGGMERLDKLIKELHKAGATTSEEVAEYLKNKDSIHNLCITICKNIGVYYSNTENVSEVYVVPWLNLGFEPEALIQVSKYCFLRNTKTLDGMQQMIQKFASQGIFTANDILSYVTRQVQFDEKIRAVYSHCGYVGAIGNKDRECYKNWEEWGFDESVILAVSERYKDKTFPMTSINRALGALRNAKIFDVNGANKFLDGEDCGRVNNAASDYDKHAYTDEQLKQAFVNFDNWD